MSMGCKTDVPCTVVVREDFSRSRCDSLVIDIRAVTENLMKLDKETVDHHVEQSEKKMSRHGKRRHARGHYKGEQHSLAKHGKTHAVC